MIGRIERENFIPSISQFESLSNALGFEITDMFVGKQETNSFIALRSEALSGSEKEGVERLFSMKLLIQRVSSQTAAAQVFLCLGNHALIQLGGVLYILHVALGVFIGKSLSKVRCSP
jgi:hypothetical protein